MVSSDVYKRQLQFLCQITVDCLRSCFNRFFAVIPCVIALRKVLHEIFYPVRNIYIPKFSFTTDNAAMIANTGYYKYLDNDFCTIDKPAYSRVTI